MFTAIINVPGYLPDTDSPPPVFETAAEAWAYLADERKRAEDEVDYPSESPLAYEYSDTWATLAYLGSEEGVSAYGSPHSDHQVNADGTGALDADTPGREEEEHDLGLVYCVVAVEEPVDIESMGFIKADLLGAQTPEFRERLAEEMRVTQQPGFFTRMLGLTDLSTIERELDKGEHRVMPPMPEGYKGIPNTLRIRFTKPKGSSEPFKVRFLDIGDVTDEQRHALRDHLETKYGKEQP